MRRDEEKLEKERKLKRRKIEQKLEQEKEKREELARKLKEKKEIEKREVKLAKERKEKEVLAQREHEKNRKNNIEEWKSADRDHKDLCCNCRRSCTVDNSNWCKCRGCGGWYCGKCLKLRKQSPVVPDKPWTCMKCVDVPAEIVDKYFCED